MKPYKQEFFNKIAKEFDTHVKQSIPLFAAVQQNIAANISSGYNQTVIDLMGSTGEMGRQLLYNGFDGIYLCVDGSPQMMDVFYSATPKSYDKDSQLRFELAGYKASWDEVYHTQTVNIPEFNWEHGHVNYVLEILGFQFFSKERENFFKDIANHTDVFITFEKVKNADPLFEKNEYLKDSLHKSKFFTEKELEEKRKNVLQDMGEYLVSEYELTMALGKAFNVVSPFARVGNFVGYICTNDIRNIQHWKYDSRLTVNKFNAVNGE